MAFAAHKQDMPPEGGYKAVPYQRLPGQKYFSNRFLFAYFGSMTFVSFVGYYAAFKRDFHKKLDNADREIAINPFVLAERDRAYMKYLKKIHDEEEKVMKDVPSWKVGHLHGLPIYKTLPDDYHLDPSPMDYFAHTSLREASGIWHFPQIHFNRINLTA